MTRPAATPPGARPSPAGQPPGADAAALLGDITWRISAVLGSVTELGAAATTLAAAAGRGGRPLRRAHLAAIRPHVASLLARHRDLVAGAGLVLAPGALADEPRWIEWWWADGESGVRPLEVDLNPESPGFYDYTTTEWYREPARTGRPCVAGPYVDYICTHKYTFTLSAPLACDGTFLGVAGADILAGQVEQAVLPGLAQLGRTAVLVSGHGRVIASNTPSVPPGAVLGRLSSTGPLRKVAGPPHPGPYRAVPAADGRDGADGAGQDATVLPWSLLAAAPVPGQPGTPQP